MKSKNSKYIFFIIIAIIIFVIVLLFVTGNLNPFQNINIAQDNSSSEFKSEQNNEVQTNNSSSSASTTKDETNKKPVEAQLSSFSTEIKDKSAGRLENIKITCDIINGTIVEPHQTFSFNEIVGQPSTQKGYKEATVIVDGEHETGIGGRQLPSKQYFI